MRNQMTEKKEMPTMMDVLNEIKDLNTIVQNSTDIKQSAKDTVDIQLKHIGSTLIDICDFIVKRECGETGEEYLERNGRNE